MTQPNFTQEEIDNLNSPMPFIEIEFVVKSYKENAHIGTYAPSLSLSLSLFL